MERTHCAEKVISVFITLRVFGGFTEGHNLRTVHLGCGARQ